MATTPALDGDPFGAVVSKIVFAAIFVNQFIMFL